MNPSVNNMSLWAIISEDLRSHAGDWMKPGFRAVAVHRFGVWRMQIRPRLLRIPFSVLYRILFRHVRNVYGIELSYTVALGRRVIIEHQGCIVISTHAKIGDDCIIHQGVTLGIRDRDEYFLAPILGNGVIVGAGAKILGNVRIGDRAKIGANAVVINDIPAGATAVGIPARVVRSAMGDHKGKKLCTIEITDADGSKAVSRI